MAFRFSEMTVLRMTDRPQFMLRMRQSISRHEGYVVRVAQDLGVGDRTVKRWIREFPDLQAHVDRVRAVRVATA